MTASRMSSIDRFAGLVPLRLFIPVILLVFVTVVGGWVYAINRRSIESGIEIEAVRDVNLDMTRLQASLEEAGRTKNPDWMQEQLAAFGADTHGLLAVLADETGKIVAAASRAQLGRELGEVLERPLRGARVYRVESFSKVRESRIGVVELIGNGGVVAGVYPVVLGRRVGEVRPNRVGLLLVARDLKIQKSQAFAGARHQAFVIGAVLLALTVATGALLHVMVTRRLARIADAADRLAAGDRSVEAGVQGRDEIAFLGQSFDSMVSDLRQNEAALLESEEQHRSLFENAVEGIVTMGEDRLIRSVNPAAQKMFGYSESELIGKNVNLLMPSPYHEEHDRYVASYVETGKKKIIGIGREVVGERSDGYTFPVELSVVDLRLSNGRVFTGILRDITDRKQAEDELQSINENLEDLVRERTQELENAQQTLLRSERLATLGQLAGSVAHEVRNPLGIVRNAAYFVEQMTRNPSEDVAESFDEIRRGLFRADRIIAELLDYARDPKINHEAFELGDAITDSLDGVDIPKNVAVHLPDSPSTVRCHGDKDQVTRILNNFVLNGIQSMPGGGALKIGCQETDDGSVVVEVQDEGEGMDADRLAKIFEPLFTTKTRGIGLGLALSQRYADLNNAELTAESEVGKGSIFRLSLPIHLV